MSDKNKILMEDRGWGQMASILDSELPQKKRTKRPVLWFFVASIVLFGGAFLFNKNNETIEKGDNESFTHETSDISQNSVSLSSIDKTTEVAKIIDTKELIKEAKINSTILISIESNSVDNNETLIFNDSSHELSKASSSSSSSSSSYQDNNTVVFSGVINNNESSFKNTILEESLSNVNQRSLLNIEKISIGNKSILSEEKPKFDLNVMNSPQNILVIKPLTKRNNLYLFAGGNIGLDQNGIGYQLGIGKMFGNKYFDFFVEGGYAHMRYKKNVSIIESVTIDFTPEISANSMEFDVNESTSLQNAIEQYQIYNTSLVDNQNYVFLTLGIEKKITKRLMILGGLTYSRFLRIENAEVNFISVDGSFQSSLDQYNISKTSLFDNGDFRKYEFSSKLGIGYQVTSRLNIFANYRIGLTDLIRNESLVYSDASIPEGLKRNSYKSIHRKNIELVIGYSF